MPQKSDKKGSSDAWRNASLALTLPTMMAAGPLVGLFLGWGVGKLLGLEPPWDGRSITIGVICGTVAGIRETVRIIKKLSSNS